MPAGAVVDLSRIVTIYRNRSATRSSTVRRRPLGSSVRTSGYARFGDLVIRGATVYDGSGDPARVCDVGVSAGRIAAVGDLVAEHASVSVDAAGLALAPGFIDVHSHDDFAVFLTPDMDFKVGQGVTTDVVGNCGLGAAPFGAARAYLAFFGADRRRESLPDWDDYAGYIDAIDADPPSLNVAALVGRHVEAGRDGQRPARTHRQRAGAHGGHVGHRLGRGMRRILDGVDLRTGQVLEHG